MVDKSIVDEMSALYQKVASLEEENNELTTRCLTFENIKDDNKRFQCFTGLPNYVPFKALFDYLEFFMVLTRLRCGLTLADLALSNNLCESTVSRIFTTWINLLYFHLKELCQMLDYCDDLGKAEKFSKFPDRKVIVDCTEIFTQKPSSLKATKEIYSNHKSHTTFKFLVAINACDAIVYVSRAGMGGLLISI